MELKYLIDLAKIQVDQWDNVEKGRGPDPEDLRERAETLIDILRDVAEMDGDAQGHPAGH